MDLMVLYIFITSSFVLLLVLDAPFMHKNIKNNELFFMICRQKCDSLKVLSLKNICCEAYNDRKHYKIKSFRVRFFFCRKRYNAGLSLPLFPFHCTSSYNIYLWFYAEFRPAGCLFFFYNKIKKKSYTFN